jgi:L-lactate utilization protein LutC
VTSLDRLEVSVRASGAELLRLDDWSELVEVCVELTTEAEVALAPSFRGSDDSRVQLEQGLKQRGVAVIVPTVEASESARVADTSLGIVRGELAVTETGSVMVSEHGRPDRLVSMLVRHLLLVVSADSIVESLHDVAAWLDSRPAQASFVSLITGPSRSADIERSLSIGVQGPERVTVVIVG